MKRSVYWTTEAESTFDDFLEYLKEAWTSREVNDFIEATERVIDAISSQPKMFRKVQHPDLREALITPQCLLIYKVYSGRIDLITFWNTHPIPERRDKSSANEQRHFLFSCTLELET